jgi:GH25 family lysozyme M1 (1,4-beta-N-acetylmuramidase)
MGTGFIPTDCFPCWPASEQQFTFVAHGSQAPGAVSLVTPVVVESRWSSASAETPVPIRGFLRAFMTGVTGALPEKP